MKREFICTHIFRNDWARAGLEEADLEKLEWSLMKHPDKGVVVKGTHGLRKIRWSRPGTGKSGGVRVWYLDLPEEEKIFLFAIIQKNEEENLSMEERNILASKVLEIKKELGRGVKK